MPSGVVPLFRQAASSAPQDGRPARTRWGDDLARQHGLQCSAGSCDSSTAPPTHLYSVVWRPSHQIVCCSETYKSSSCARTRSPRGTVAGHPAGQRWTGLEDSAECPWRRRSGRCCRSPSSTATGIAKSAPSARQSGDRSRHRAWPDRYRGTHRHSRKRMCCKTFGLRARARGEIDNQPHRSDETAVRLLSSIIRGRHPARAERTPPLGLRPIPDWSAPRAARRGCGSAGPAGGKMGLRRWW